jgi:hypothetical protein
MIGKHLARDLARADQGGPGRVGRAGEGGKTRRKGSNAWRTILPRECIHRKSGLCVHRHRAERGGCRVGV